MMLVPRIAILPIAFFIVLFCTSCTENTESPRQSNTLNSSKFNDVAATQSKQPSTKENHLLSEKESNKDTNTKPTLNYNKLRNAITFGKASLAEVKQALTESDVVNLTNTLHALYSMRWHRGVYHIYYDLWHLKKDKHPDFAWETLEKTPARIALASTINRVQIYDAEEFQDYIRAHMHDEHEFHRAQVVVALGLNGDPDDVDYIKSMASGDNHYVTQSAISSLALIGHDKARDAMIELYEKYYGTPRGDLLINLLDKAYQIKPNDFKVKKAP